MLTFAEIPGVEISIALLIFLGFAIGMTSGFIGVGGGFALTPALIILGFPANFAVGTSMSYIAGTSIISAIRHRQLGNIDPKLGIIVIIGMLLGVEIGVRILNWVNVLGLADTVVLTLSIIVLTAIGIFTFVETSKKKVQLDEMLKRGEVTPRDLSSSPLVKRIQRLHIPPIIDFPKSRISVSLWIILGIGLFTGTLAGIIGIGGGFIMMPSLIYLLGVPSIMAVGTNILQIIFSGAFGCIRHSMSGNVIIIAAFITIFGACIGTQIGSLGTRFVRGLSVRFILSYSIFFFALASSLKLISIITGEGTGWLQTASLLIIFIGLGLMMLVIAMLFVMGIRYSRGSSVPRWLVTFLAR